MTKQELNKLWEVFEEAKDYDAELSEVRISRGDTEYKFNQVKQCFQEVGNSENELAILDF